MLSATWPFISAAPEKACTCAVLKAQTLKFSAHRHAIITDIFPENIAKSVC